MRSRLTKPVVVALRDVLAVVETLPAGTIVEFDAIPGRTEVASGEMRYTAMLQDLLDATRPPELCEAEVVEECVPHASARALLTIRRVEIK